MGLIQFMKEVVERCINITVAHHMTGYQMYSLWGMC